MQLDPAAWAEVRREYSETTQSIRKLAERYGASPRTITDRAKREGWPPRPGGAPALGPRPRKASAKVDLLDQERIGGGAATQVHPQITPNAAMPTPTAQPTTGEAAGAGDAEDEAETADAPVHVPSARHTKPRSSADAPVLPSRQAQRDLIARLYRAISTKLELMERRMANGEERSAQDEERETRALSTMIRNFEKVTEAVTDFDRAKKPGTREPATTRADAERMRREITERLERLHGGRDTKREPGGAG